MVRVEAAGYGSATFGPCDLGANISKTFDLKLQSPAAAPAQGSVSDKPGGGTPQFSDEPQFTVAGVTDGTNLGGHGSNTMVRTKESLAKDVTTLGAPANQQTSGTNPDERSLRSAADREPANFDANHRLGKLLLGDSKGPEALPYLERAARLKPGDYENSYLLASAYAVAGQNQQARAKAQALLTHDPSRDSLTPRQQAAVHHLLGDIQENSGNPLEAVREYQSAAELNPSESNLFDWGAELLQHRAVEPAIDVFSKGNRLFPQSARMLVALGVSWYSHGSYDQAALRLCEASDLNPNDPEPYLFLGKMQSVETAQSACSFEKLKQFTELQPQNALARYYYGLSLWKRRKGPDDNQALADAQLQLNKSVQLDPKLAVAYLQLGILDSAQNDFPGAILSYRKAIQANPEMEEAHYRLAQVYKRTGEKEKAQQEVQLYQQISKKTDDQVERERRESRQFVYTLRSPAPESQSR